MKLSVIIVNYNVVHFLEQCLNSVVKALKDIDSEVFVVDNNSVDGSVAMVKEKFPQVKLIENKKNYGFSYANNQAIKQAKGEYILLLNPDTLVEEDTFEKCIDFMDQHPDAGGLGVKMIDGKGNFLPESKRGLPTPFVAFCKIFGLSMLFPKSKKFGKYHLGYLDKDKIWKVDVLSGAFMLLRKKVLDEIGYLDEEFFMYGEDIDISYRITQSGYTNYYFPETTIIHYKGESTKKGSINYVRVFYNAMIIFAKKHFSKKHAKSFSFLINFAIYFRAFIAIISRVVKTLFLPVIEALVIFLGFYFIKPYWEKYKFGGLGHYPDEFLMFAVPSYILVWLTSIYLAGGYEKPAKIFNILKGIFFGTLFILSFYALLSEEYRFSRALILFGAAWTFISVVLLRILMHVLNIEDYKLYSPKRKKVAIVGSPDEAKRIAAILNQSENGPEITGFISVDDKEMETSFIGHVNQLKDIVKINKINEIIFCAKDITAQKIIQEMLSLNDVNIEYKIASPDSITVIGSSSINTSGDLYTINLNSIAKQSNRRNKRIIDIFLAILFFILFPLIIWFQKKPLNYFKNIFNVLFGLKSWVGYYIYENFNQNLLPKIKKGVLSPVDIIKNKEMTPEIIDRLNMAYAKDYNVLNDFVIIVKGFRLLSK